MSHTSPPYLLPFATNDKNMNMHPQQQQHHHHHHHKNKKIQWKIRPATTTDADAVKELLDTSYTTLLPDDHGHELTMKALPIITKPQPELLHCGTWYVVHDPATDKLVGCGGWSYHVHKDAAHHTSDGGVRKVPHLRHFATHPDWLRKGIGRAIWNQVVRDLLVGDDSGALDERLLPTMEVFSSLTGEAFYASLGFVPVKKVELPLKKDCMFPCILMRRESHRMDSDSNADSVAQKADVKT